MFTPTSYWQRHIRNVYKYGNLQKYLNIMHAYISFLLKKKNITSMPAFLKVEVCRYCDVQCLYCYMDKANVLYPFDLYMKLIDQFKDYIFLVSLYDIGEPLHNPHLLEYVKYANNNNVGTIISSSLSVEKDDSYWIELVTSGLDTLIVAIDGITPEVYNYYRRNGKFDLIFSNLKKIIEYRNKYSSKLLVEWQMVDFEWNQHEQSEAKKMALAIGCDRFRIIAEAANKRLSNHKKEIIRDRNCILPYLLFFVTAHNEVRLCYKVYNHDMRIGSLNNNSFIDIWNGSQIARVRDPKQIINRIGCQHCNE
ncbi:MAG: radical SAM protein [Chlorobiaceae bacterium]